MDSSANTDEVVRQEKEQLTEDVIVRSATDIPNLAASANTDKTVLQEKEQLTEDVIMRSATDIPNLAASANKDKTVLQEKELLIQDVIVRSATDIPNLAASANTNKTVLPEKELLIQDVIVRPATDVPNLAASANTDKTVLPEKELLTEEIIIRPATADDILYAEEIAAEMEASAKARGTGIAKRSPFSIAEKIRQGKAVIALTVSGIWAGFSYLETWEQDKFISNSGLIVAPAFRVRGIAAMIKQKIFQLSRALYPTARVFSITTGRAVMKLNTRLGFEPVTYAEITKDPAFWEGCKSCVNYSILCAKGKQNCLCTALLFEPS